MIGGYLKHTTFQHRIVYRDSELEFIKQLKMYIIDWVLGFPILI